MIAYLIVCPLVFLAGLVDSIAGGGGLVSLPGYLIAGVPPHMALGTNKMSSAVGTVVSTVRLASHGYLKGKMMLAGSSALLALAGSSMGAQLALRLPDSVIRHMMVVILPFVAFYVLRNKRMDGEENRKEVSVRTMYIAALAAAFFVGAYDGFYGPGTGTFLILILTGVAGMDIRTAAAQTKVVNLASNVAALVTFLATGNVNYRLGLAAGACSIAGHYIGSGLVVHDGQRIVRPVVLLVLVTLFIRVLMGY